MRARWIRVVVGATVALGGGLVSVSPAYAADLSAGTVTVQPYFERGNFFTLHGRFAAGGASVVTTATGWSSDTPDGRTPIALSGVGITGTCTFGPTNLPTVITPPLPVPNGSERMYCSVSIYGRPVAPMSLILTIQAPGLGSSTSGLFVGGVDTDVTATPAIPTRSDGTAVKQIACGLGQCSVYLALTGHLHFGGHTFTGTATSLNAVGAPHTLHGTSPAGDLDATCTDFGPAALKCVGSIGTGPTGHTNLALVLGPYSQDSVPKGTSSHAEGVFAG